MKASELRDKLKRIGDKLGCFVTITIYIVEAESYSKIQYRLGWVPDIEGFSKYFDTLAELNANLDKLLEV